MRKTKPAPDGVPKLLVRPDVAGWMLSVDESKLADFGVQPVVRGHRLTLYDVRDLEAARDRLRVQAGMAPHEAAR